MRKFFNVIISYFTHIHIYSLIFLPQPIPLSSMLQIFFRAHTVWMKLLRQISRRMLLFTRINCALCVVYIHSKKKLHHRLLLCHLTYYTCTAQLYFHSLFALVLWAKHNKCICFLLVKWEKIGEKMLFLLFSSNVKYIKFSLLL